MDFLDGLIDGAIVAINFHWCTIPSIPNQIVIPMFLNVVGITKS